MNKKIIAMAVAGALVAPLAQAEVTVGGRMYIEYQNGTDETNPAYAPSNGAYATVTDDQGIGRIFIKASEDLGNGMTMYGKQEMSYQMGTSATGAKFGMRDGYVGIKGGFGDFAMGDFVGAYATTNIDAFTGTGLEARGNGGAFKDADGIANNSFVKNVMRYKTKVGGTSINFQTNLLNSDPSTYGANSISKMSLAVKMKNGFALGYSSKDDNTTTTTFTKLAYKAKSFGVAYEMADASTILLLNYKMAMGKNNTLHINYGAETPDVGVASSYIMVGGIKKFAKTAKMVYGYRISDKAGLDDSSLVVGLRKDF